MLGSILLVGGILLGQAEAKPADSDQASALAQQVRKLVRQLDAPQLKLRDAAEEDLMKLGPGVLDLLPKNVDPSQAEVAQRLARVRQKLQRQEAEEGIQPSRVTLQGKMPLTKVLEAIEKQTGNKIVDVRRAAVANVPDPEISVNFEKTPFWQAIDRVLDQAGLVVYPYGDKKALQVAPQSEQSKPHSKFVVYNGPFRFEPITVTAERDLRDPASQSLKLEMEIAWEPRVEPISLVQRTADLAAADEKGQTLKVASEGAEMEAMIERGPIAKRLVLRFAPPPRDVKQIAQLSGTLRAMVPGKEETFRFKDLGKNKNVEKRVAGVTMTLLEVLQNNNAWEICTLLRFDSAKDALASHRTWVFDNPAYLEGPDGKQVKFGSYDTTEQTENTVGVAYLFAIDKPLAEYTFVYKTPTMIFSLPLKYEFKDIPLP